jgi:hypothetical protein
MAHHWRTPKQTSTAPAGAGWAMLLLAGLMLVGVLALHVFAVQSGVRVASTPITLLP